MTVRRFAMMLMVVAAVTAGPAAAEEDWIPAATLAVGGAGRAMPLDNAGITINPAAMINVAPRYSVETGFQRFDPTRSNVLHFSAMDCQTSALAMGISQTFEWARPPFDPDRDLSWYNTETVDEIDDKIRVDRFAWALAYGFAQRRFNIGAALRVYHVQDPLRGNRTPVSFDVGMTWWISPNVAIGVTGGNLVPTKTEAEPTTLAAGFGASVLSGILWFELDGVMDFTSADKPQLDLRSGAQVTIAQQFKIRGGFASDTAFKQQFVSWGIGWQIPYFSINYTMRIELGEMERIQNPDKPEVANRMLHAWLVAVTF